jgi:hypothetical protein
VVGSDQALVKLAVNDENGACAASSATPANLHRHCVIDATALLASLNVRVPSSSDMVRHGVGRSDHQNAPQVSRAYQLVRASPKFQTPAHATPASTLYDWCLRRRVSPTPVSKIQSCEF